ncbi:PIN-like domain-containing protein [Clostridium sp. UBA7339]|uniref:PIN-like domain-containing protein n=1 Tax=Clostridium sp. UBA7339 TaxID=1946376 RepID=UPI00321763D7
MDKKFEEFLNNDTIIVFDTNIYLNLYEYSPEVADKFIEAIYFIEKYIYIPSTVKREVLRNHLECSGRQKKKFKNVSKELKKLTDKLSVQLNKQLNILDKFKFPKIDDLKNNSLAKLLEVEKTFDKYLEENDVYEVINKVFLEQDKILELFNGIMDDKRVFEELTADELYSICSEGKNRYYKEIPPGFKDGKTKDGIDKYNDLILWKEVLKYCKKNDKNLIFVTDDVKPDWWIDDGIKKEFHSFLIKEFKEITYKDIFALNSQQLYGILGELYNISTPDTIQTVLQYSLQKYIDQLIKYSDLTYDIQSEIVNSGERYVNTESLTNYDGSYFEMKDEINDIDLIGYTLEDYQDGIATYNIVFDIKVNAESKCYWGRDDDTKDVILSDNYRIHELSGELTVEIMREVDNEYIADNINDIINEFNFSEFKIMQLELEEVDSIDSDDLCVQCGKDIGTVFFGDDGEMVCDECAVQDSEGEICPSCGRKMPFESMAGNGFCIDCTNESDYL